jgi:hypothetical protein
MPTISPIFDFHHNENLIHLPKRYINNACLRIVLKFMNEFIPVNCLAVLRTETSNTGYLLSKT